LEGPWVESLLEHGHFWEKYWIFP